MDVVMPKPGRYVLAVSGGVDSMALLHILSQDPKIKLTVAHLDHGIRQDSAEDMQLVKKISDTLGVPCVCHQIELGSSASEAQARIERYKFLNKVLMTTQADAIITAHHQDDLIETAIINILRGTGRKGLTSLNSREGILRPLLNVSKPELIQYAHKHKLVWREDSTNQDVKYLRNYVRLNIVPKLDDKSRAKLLKLINSLQLTNQDIDSLLVNELKSQSVKDKIDRAWFNKLPHEVAREVIATWLRQNEIRDFDKKTIERVVVSAKTADAGKSLEVTSGHTIKLTKEHLALTMAER